MKRDYPNWICSDCGNKYGRRECGVATWHPSTCEICGEDNVYVTEPRDFGHLKDAWDKVKKHDPNCAVVRQGNIRAWCDCGADKLTKSPAKPK